MVGIETNFYSSSSCFKPVMVAMEMYCIITLAIKGLQYHCSTVHIILCILLAVSTCLFQFGV